MGCHSGHFKRRSGNSPPTLPGVPAKGGSETAHLSEWAAFNSVPRAWQAIAVQAGDDSFISTSPDTINSAATIRIALAASPNIAIPTRKAPTAPIPVQIV